jgi:hypothetical protein
MLLSLRSLQVIGCRPALTQPISNALGYSLVSTPRLLQLSPAEGSASGGTQVSLTLTGAGGRAAADITVSLAGVACPIVSYTDQGALQLVACLTGAHGGASSGLPWSGGVSVHVASLGLAAVNNESSSFEYINLWSDPNTWGGMGLPVEGDTIFVPQSQTVVLDVSPPRLYFLVIQGHLRFARTNLKLDAR